MSTAVFAGCEAVTAGIGTIGCAAVAGAAGSLASQGVKCAQDGGDDCDASAFAESAVEGAVSGAAGGALGSLGGKVLGKLAPKALDAVGGLFGKGAAEAEDGAVSDAMSAATDDGASGAGTEEPGSSCPLPHSFTAGTQVLMADGTSKAIDRIKVGDEVANSVPGAKGLEKHKVERVIVTRTDHDFVKLTIKPLVKKAVRKAALGLAASAAAVTTRDVFTVRDRRFVRMRAYSAVPRAFTPGRLCNGQNHFAMEWIRVPRRMRPRDVRPGRPRGGQKRRHPTHVSGWSAVLCGPRNMLSDARRVRAGAVSRSVVSRRGGGR